MLHFAHPVFMASSQAISYEFVTTVDGVNKVLDALKNFKTVAFDCEGVDLGRHGVLTVVSLAGFDPVASSVAYVIDVQVIGAVAFTTGLGALLESSEILKVMFDCRSDSDALWHQFKVHGEQSSWVLPSARRDEWCDIGVESNGTTNVILLKPSQRSLR